MTTFGDPLNALMALALIAVLAWCIYRTIRG